MSLIEQALEQDAELPFPYADSNRDEEEREAASDLMVDFWEAICLHTWPQREVGSSSFDSEVLGQLGIGIGELANSLGIATPVAVGLYRGEIAPTIEQLEAIANLTRVDPETLLSDGLDDESLGLLSPGIKDDVLAIAANQGVGEAEARDLLRAEFALAARSDGDPASRLASALHRLLRKGPHAR